MRIVWKRTPLFRDHKQKTWTICDMEADRKCAAMSAGPTSRNQAQQRFREIYLPCPGPTGTLGNRL